MHIHSYAVSKLSGFSLNKLDSSFQLRKNPVYMLVNEHYPLHYAFTYLNRELVHVVLEEAYLSEHYAFVFVHGM